MTVSEWADINRVLPKGTSARAGQWRTESFQREPMDSILDPEVQEVVWMKSTQVGGSEAMNNMIGFFMDADPRPMMMVQPVDQSAKEYSQKRIDPMLEATPCLQGKVRETSSSSKHGSQSLKQFDGGFLKIVGSKSAPALRSDYVSVIFFDEVEGYDDDVNGEGNPIVIATKRTGTDPEAKIFKASTPGQRPKGFSLIEEAYNDSSKARYFVPCPFCNTMQVLVWRGLYALTDNSYESSDEDDEDDQEYNLVWEMDDKGDIIERSVRYRCASCKELIDEKYKRRMLDAGRWVHKYPDRKRVRGYHINALYAPWKTIWPSLASEWKKAQGNPEKLKAFITLNLGQTWNEGASSLNSGSLTARRKPYQMPDGTEVEIPRGVGVLIASADIQRNRIEAQILGFGKGEESWLIDHEIFTGDPGLPDVWDEVDEWLRKERQHECGLIMKPAITLIDSGDGENVDAVYDFVLPRQNTSRRVFACKGTDYLSRPGLVQEGTTKRNAVRLWMVATHAAKDRIFARMKIKQPGPGYMNFPDWATDEYFSQVTAEKKIPFTNKRTRVTKHVYVKSHRNEALDMTVYCHAGLFVLQNFIDKATYGDLSKLVDAVQAGSMPQLQRRQRGVRFPGFNSREV
jgi:phage terminase large subunit GpA-like protein